MKPTASVHAPASPGATPSGKAALASVGAERTSERQAALSLGLEHDPGVPVTVADFLRALNFPDTAEDAEGFRALALALGDPGAARLIRAAEDVLTLLSKDGLYMDDLPAGQGAPEIWRRFARGVRDGAVARLAAGDGGFGQARVATRLREDAVFRDAVHHFLRQFDHMLEAFEPNASDAELAQLADTRSARAFMLLGSATGIFG